MDIDKLRQSLILHEGFEPQPYQCTAGRTTIGIGRNIEDVGITMDEALFLLDNDIERCLHDLGRNVPGWRLHDEVRQNILLEMVFNLGIGRFLTFRKMLEALAVYDYNEAANQMLDSRWAQQVGQRAQTLADMMRSGQWAQ